MCDERTLLLLVHDIEGAISHGNSEGASVGYVRLPFDKEFGKYAAREERPIALRTVWLPTWLREAGIDKRIRQILAGKLKSLSISEQAKISALYH